MSHTRIYQHTLSVCILYTPICPYTYVLYIYTVTSRSMYSLNILFYSVFSPYPLMLRAQWLQDRCINFEMYQWLFLWAWNKDGQVRLFHTWKLFRAWVMLTSQGVNCDYPKVPNNPVPTSRFSGTKTSWLILCREVTVLYCGNHMNCIIILCGRTAVHRVGPYVLKMHFIIYISVSGSPKWYV
jgi:hypothetical protein